MGRDTSIYRPLPDNRSSKYDRSDRKRVLSRGTVMIEKSGRWDSPSLQLRRTVQWKA